MHNELHSFNPKRMKTNEKVWPFWEKHTNTYAALYALAKIVLAVPGTQVSVERLFSQLKFILNDNRANLSSTVLNNILLLKSNYTLFE